MSYGNNGVNNHNNGIITFMSYDEFADIQEQMDARRKCRKAKERKNRAMYFHRQRIMGAAIGLVGIALLILGCYLDTRIMQAFGAFTGVFGLLIITTRQMVLVDSYYLECQERMRND